MTLDERFDNPRLRDAGATFLRLGLGLVFLAHAFAKLFLFTLPGTVQFFSAHGFPGWTAYPVFAAELLGGALLVLGIQTRLVSLVLIPVMVGALLVHLPSGWMFTNPGGGWEYVAFLISALGTQVLLGDGAFALGRVISRRSPKARLAHAAGA
ncbi:DoxX family protein [Vitiosangium sp. GDMCC 1.1324]|uniref:DoxX family protein n=1 Tax=Vitiosangium sp. (strain GDMCC 1.1324) TaxID=2138576 RepID=UPI000D372FA4|nr:DoxX family protein [Vitiosangium sp. GDMCC 1.1324]PTL84779.1 hypothetical protein DAT35_06875 [Vitiosangium sp. GDMCC 1.1324]